jgi:DtxR family Mn-dependent transcriptional regulator
VETTSSGEDYLKVIYQMLARDEPVTTSTLARRRGVSPPSVTAMVKRLEEQRLVERSADHRVELTPAGERVALEVTRRHRLAELFLQEILGFEWHEVHDHAEVLEHVLRGALEERIDRLLGHPTHDPHGDPIPPQDLHGHVEAWPTSLEEAAPGSGFAVERVADRDSGALEYLGRLGIRPGVSLVVGERDPFGGPIWVEVDGHRHALGLPLACLVYGSAIPPP